MESSKGFPNAGSGFSSKVPRRPRGLQRTVQKDAVPCVEQLLDEPLKLGLYCRNP